MRSIQSRLTFWLLLAFAVLTSAGGFAIYFAVRASLYAQFDDGLRVKALIVITATEQRRGKINVDFSDRYLREFDDDVATDFYQVWAIGGNGNTERSDSLGKAELPQKFGSMKSPRYWNLNVPGSGRSARAVGIKFTPRVDDDDERTRQSSIEAVTVVAADRRQLDAMLQRLALVLLAAGVGLMLVTSVTVPIALRPGLRPLRRLGDQAGAIDATNLAQRFPIDAMPAELRPIGDRLNALLARLESSFARERRFGADLAHELLTPLAELRAIVESALKWPESSGPETHRQSLTILLRMETLVTRLLELCRAENGRLAVMLAPTSIPTLVRATWQPFAATAQTRRLNVTFAGPEPCEIASDAALLRVIFGNLASNAVEYTPAGGNVSVTWENAASTFILRVENEAPHLTAGDVAQMFDRFWRKDAARTDGQHSGLGLSVAREWAQVLGGTLVAELSPTGIYRVEFRIATR